MAVPYRDEERTCLLPVGFDSCGGGQLVEGCCRADRVGQLWVVWSNEFAVEPTLTASSCGRGSDRVAAEIVAQFIAGAADEGAAHAVDRAGDVERFGEGRQRLVP